MNLDGYSQPIFGCILGLPGAPSFRKSLALSLTPDGCSSRPEYFCTPRQPLLGAPAGRTSDKNSGWIAWASIKAMPINPQVQLRWLL
jgi:hypothetical protein